MQFVSYTLIQTCSCSAGVDVVIQAFSFTSISFTVGAIQFVNYINRLIVLVQM